MLFRSSIANGEFYPGEIVVGTASSARYAVQYEETDDLYNKYEENKEIQDEASVIVDFSEKNPFGEF